MKKYIKYIWLLIIPFYVELFFPNILNLFPNDDLLFPTSIIGKIYVFGFVFPLILYIYLWLIWLIILNRKKILKVLFYSPLTILQSIAVILLIIALYDIQAMVYFTFLRIYIFSVAIFTMYKFIEASKKVDNEEKINALQGSSIFLFIIAVLFNPIFPIYFWDKTPWYWIDGITAFFFINWIIVKEYRIPKD